MSVGGVSAPAGFRVGDRVRVSKRSAQGHCRTPWYLRGKSGVVCGVQGAYRDPEKLAYHLPGLPARQLYKVRFALTDIWGTGGSQDGLEADIYEHWLEPERAR